MKAFLLAVVFCGLSFVDVSANEQPLFIIVTTKTAWPDGTASDVGVVEVAAIQTPQCFVLFGGGNTHVVPIGNAQRVTTEEAVVALLIQRQKLYSDIQLRDQALVAALGAKAAGASASRPTQYNGRPLPRNWIDPAQADANFNAQQQLRQQQATQAEIQRLRQELQKQRR